MPMGERVAVFWDFENVRAPSGISGYPLASKIRSVAHQFGTVTLFRAYVDLAELVYPKSANIRSGLQTSGVTLVDCPHNGRKDVADKMIIVDMLAFAIDHPAPATIILISGDCDFAYAVSTLRLRGYEVVLVAPKNSSMSIKSVASRVLDWDSDVLGRATDTPSVLWRRSDAPFAPEDPPPIPLDCKPDVFTISPESFEPAPVAVAPDFTQAPPDLQAVERAVPSAPNRSVPPPAQRQLHSSGDSMYELRQSFLPWTIFEHLLAGSRSCSPATSETAISEVTTASYLTSASSADPSPIASPFTRSPVQPTTSSVPPSTYPPQSSGEHIIMEVPEEVSQGSSSMAVKGAAAIPVSGGASKGTDDAQTASAGSQAATPLAPGASAVPVVTSVVSSTAVPVTTGASSSEVPVAAPTAPSLVSVLPSMSSKTVSVGPVTPSPTVSVAVSTATPAIRAVAAVPSMSVKVVAAPPLPPSVQSPKLPTFTSSTASVSQPSSSKSAVAPVQAPKYAIGTSVTRSSSSAMSVPDFNPGRLVPPTFVPLVKYLEAARRSGESNKKWTTVTADVWNREEIYSLAKTRKFKEYMMAAMQADIVDVPRPITGSTIVTLKSRWHGATF